MRIRTLHLQRFGPFTDQRLDLEAGGRGGLHVIYGPNEAGKSTSLRAVTGLLFGIPTKSEDAHLHAATELRLGATLERRDEGEVVLLDLVRHKRRRNPLTDKDGRPLDDVVLAPFLLGTTRASFQNRYALDQRQLELGAKALLTGAEEGLFAAGSAGAGVAQVLLRLDEDQAALFRPRGQKYLLNQLLEQLRESEKHLRLSERPAEKWQEQKRDLERASTEVGRLEARRSQIRTELSRKNRLASMLTDVSRLVDAEEELGRLAHGPLVPSESTDERLRALADQRDAAHEAQVHQSELALLEERASALGEPTSLETVEEERLAVLRNQLGSELKALSDLPKRSAKLDQLSGLLSEQLRILGRPQTNADELLVDLVEETHLRRLAAEHGQLESEVMQLRRSVRRLEAEEQEHVRGAGELRGEIERDGGAVAHGGREMLARAREGLPAIRGLAELQRRLLLTKEEARRLGEELGAPRFTLPPSTELLEALLSEHRELDGRRHALRRERETLAGERAESLARAEALREALALPSEEQLRGLRAERDELLGERSWSAPDEARFERLRAVIRDSDQVGDRLRREAARVSELVALGMDAAAADARLAQMDEREKQQAALELAWARRVQDHFSQFGTPPLDASALRALHTRWVRWAEVTEEAKVLEIEQTRLAHEEQHLRQVLLQGGQTADEARLPLETLLARAEGALEARSVRSFALQEIQKKQQQTARQLAEEVRSLEASDERLRTWSNDWQKATKQLGFGSTPNPAEVQGYLSRLGELSSVAREQREMQRRVDGMRRDATMFSDLFAQLARQHAPDLAERAPIEGAEELLGRARRAREAHGQRVRVGEELARRRQLLGEAERRRDAARARLLGLMKLSGASSLEEQLELEVRSARRRELTEVVRTLEDALRSRSGGQLRVLIDEVRGLDHDVLRSEIEDLEDALREVDGAHQAAAREAASIQQGLERYGTEDAADARQRAMHRRASAAHTLRELLVLRAARLLLEGEMVDYAREHRSSLLARAEVLFSRLTLGKYRGLSIGLGQRELLALRDEKHVKVDELSSGARAQLYLALRLASLEGSLNVPDPLPLVLDDLFVEFDEDRAVAAFEILGDIAQRTQILYFTHLARDVDAAHDATRSGRVFVHRLAAS